jgi:hypothetical protein
VKFIVVGVDGIAKGDFTDQAATMWTIGGSRVVTPGGSITVSISDEVAAKEWMQLGNLVVALPHPDLELWAGVLDTPWGATLPVKVTLYSIEYLLHLRNADNQQLEKGTAASILHKMVALANSQEEMFLRIGTVNNASAIQREETIKQTSVWDQFQALAQRTATEFVTRPAFENGRLMIYLDLAGKVGVDTNFLLYDGDGGNMSIESATVDGDIINRVIGIGTQSTTTSRLQTAPQVDIESVQRHRLRSKVQQFDVQSESALLANTQDFLNSAKNPYIKLGVKILNHDHVFRLLRRGNSFITHASNVYLPGGVRAWKGITRLYAMTYNEADQSVSMILTGVYNG